MLKKIKEKRRFWIDKKKVLNSSLFDPEYYLENNPDVRVAAINPVRHYLYFGSFEGRKPSEKFDSQYYLEQNPDVKMSGINPLIHYIDHGQQEGRSPFQDFKKWRILLQRDIDEAAEKNVFKKQTQDFTLSFLIIAETSIPQCRKYRVDQKAELLLKNGYRCKIVDWNDASRVLELLQSHSVAIFYRVPGTPQMLEALQEARLLGVTCFFELDDLIFDREILAKNPNLAQLDKIQYDGLLRGADLYKKMLVACENVIASTSTLGTQMKETGGGDSFVIENALDDETLAVAQHYSKKRTDDRVQIIYGSGTNTHNSDLAVASEALEMIVKNYDFVDIVIVGKMEVPAWLRDEDTRLVRHQELPFMQYLEILAEADISIAPLTDNLFNNAKSNIKYLEAAIFGIPSVCSPRKAFIEIINPGENGFLASTTGEWFTTLEKLVLNCKLRQRIGEAAKKHVVEYYSPVAIFARQYMPFCKKYETRTHDKIRVMEVNIFFPPNSYGGATIVAEELSRIIEESDDMQVAVFTSAFHYEIAGRSFVRTAFNNIPVFRVRVDPEDLNVQNIKNLTAERYFGEAICAFNPDIVHFHSIQGLGAGLPEICRDHKIPYIITLHDAWWLCERQFRVKSDGRFCGQITIDHKKCEPCFINITQSKIRIDKLFDTLQHAACLLSPSENWREFYLKNGIEGKQIRVNENGICIPEKNEPNGAGKDFLRFGFVAGNETIKGYQLVKQVFENTKAANWQLSIVDHASHQKAFGARPISISGRGRVKVLPKYTCETAESFWKEIDVLLFPTQMPESFGLTVREALVRNKWVIATNFGGVSNAIDDGENGTFILFDPDPRYLQNAVEDLLAKPGRLLGWENPYRDRIRSFEEQAEELMCIYREVHANAGELVK